MLSESPTYARIKRRASLYPESKTKEYEYKF